MAEAGISCSSGYTVKIRRIRDRWLSVKSRNERYVAALGKTRRHNRLRLG